MVLNPYRFRSLSCWAERMYLSKLIYICMLLASRYGDQFLPHLVLGKSSFELLHRTVIFGGLCPRPYCL
ncbi:hypothetical protein XENTR_v10006303 [Xenopus tropicalis]|nr:hypothetical protein XENTR_v10006303 [Xenopus tropicalis]